MAMFAHGNPLGKTRYGWADSWSLAIIGLALLYQLSYFGFTSYAERNADADAHLQYVMLLLNGHGLPSARICPMCHHPPLYYAVAALVVRTGSVLGVTDTPRLLQGLSLLFSAGFLACSAWTFRQYVDHLPLRRLGLALVAFWPSTVIASCRLHNDSLANLLILGSATLLLRWNEDGRAKDLLLASVLVGLSLLTKATGLAALGLWIVLVSSHLARAGATSITLRRLVLPASILIGLLGVAYALKWPTRNANACQQIAGRWCQLYSTAEPNTLVSYVTFDIGEFLRHPYLIVRFGSTETGLFWHTFLKSSLFGMYPEPADRATAYLGGARTAIAMNYALLSLLGYALLSAWFLGRTWFRRHAALLCATAISVGLVVAFRASIPNGHHSDFRHAQSVLVWCGVLLMNCIDHWRRRSRPSYVLGVTLAMAALIGAVGYFLPRWPETSGATSSRTPGWSPAVQNFET